MMDARKLPKLERVSLPVVVSLTVETINDFMDVMAVIHKWTILTPIIRTTVLCQAGTTTEATVAIPTGYVCTRSAPLEITSDYYDKDILVHVYVDDEANDLTYGGLSLTDKIVIGMGKFFMKRNYLKFKIVNNTTNDAYVTFQFPCHMIKEKTAQDVFIRLLEQSCADICSYIGVDPTKVEG